MKFILGYIKGSKSKFYDGPKVFWKIRADHDGKSYEFDRLEGGENGVFRPVLKVYDSDDYPDALIKALMDSGQIIEYIVTGKS